MTYRRKKTEIATRLETQLDQLSTILMARATLIAVIDCDARFDLVHHMRAYLADHRAATRLERALEDVWSIEDHDPEFTEQIK